MPCAIPKQDIDDAAKFHGHLCPGLAIGIRAAEICLSRIGHHDQCGVTAVAETDMCGVDGIQFLTGCTLGKGNLIHRDYGKMAFTFHNRGTKQAVRCLYTGHCAPPNPEFTALNAKETRTGLTPQENARLKELKIEQYHAIMNADLDGLFEITNIDTPPPSPARVLESMTCAACGEKTMESRTRRLGGQTYCIPCFNKLEQKI